MGIFDKLFRPPNVEELKAKKDIEGLIKALKYKNDDVRCEATKALAEIKDVRAEEPLIQALKDEDRYVRIEATKALGEIRDPMAVEPLIQALKDKDSSVRGAVTKALGEIKDPGAVESLIQALEDENIVNRGYAMEALGNIGDARAVAPLIKNIERDEASNALVKIGKPAVEPLTQALKDKNASVRKRAATILGSIGNRKAVEPLIKTLNDDDVFVRCTVAMNLGKIGDERAVEQLIHALKDEDGRVRWDSAQALERIGEPAVEALNQALKDENERVRKAAKEILEKIEKSKTEKQKETVTLKLKSGRLLRDLSVIKEDKIEECRKWIIRVREHTSMFSGSTSEVIEFVTEMVQQTENYILSCEGISHVEKGFLLTSLGARGVRDTPVLEIQYDQYWQDGSSAIYSEFVLRTGDDQFEVFGSEKSAARMAKFGAKKGVAAAEKPEKQGEAERVKQLIIGLDGSFVEIEKNISALVEIGEKAVKPLFKALEDFRLRWGAIVALGDIGDARAVEHITPLLNDIDPQTRGAAAIALGKIGDSRAIDPLIQVLTNEKGVIIREFAIQALGLIGDEKAVGPIKQALNDENESIRKAARDALEKIKKT